jgi:hypothetical protein
MHKIRVPEWCCAIRFNEDEKTSLLDDNKKPFTVIKDSARYWTADPFLFKHNGEYYLFFEMFDRLKRKGLIGYRKLENGSAEEMNIVYEGEGHLSYPFIYEENGVIFIIPESMAQNELFRLRCLRFPDRWKKELIHADDRLVDTTRFVFDDREYFFSQRVIRDNTFNRLDLFYIKDGIFCEAASNPQKLDFETSRCAGAVFSYGEDYIRPSQDCSQSYGEKLIFSRIVKLKESEYLEEPVAQLSVRDVRVGDGGRYTGIHTYNKLDNIEVIDLKKEKSFNLLNLAGGVLKRVKRRS